MAVTLCMAQTHNPSPLFVGAQKINNLKKVKMKFANICKINLLYFLEKNKRNENMIPFGAH